MNFYKIGYGSPEDSGEIVMMHASVYSRDDFDRLVKDVTPDAARRVIAAYPPDIEVCQLPFSEVYTTIADLLVERHGFKRVEFAANYVRSGWADLFTRGSWGGQNDDLHAVIVAAGVKLPFMKP